MPDHSPPKILEPICRQLGIAHRVLDILVAQVVLQSAGIVAIVGELEPARMSKHVRVHSEGHLCCLAEAPDEMMEAHGADWPATLGNEYVGVCRVIAA